VFNCRDAAVEHLLLGTRVPPSSVDESGASVAPAESQERRRFLLTVRRGDPEIRKWRDEDVSQKVHGIRLRRQAELLLV
jgi:hypothetical protein